MILYNMRERGALEYDKFTLNILQIKNAIDLSETEELSEFNSNKNSLNQITKAINKTYELFEGTNDNTGLCEKIFLQSFKLK